MLEEEKVEKKGKKKKLPGWVIAPILLALVVLFWGISALSSKKPTGSSVNVITAKKGEVKETYSSSGLVGSEKEKVFYSPVNAPIATCSAKVGEAVNVDQMLVTFDITDLETENQKSQLNALSAQYTNQDAIEQSNKGKEAAAKAQASATKTKNQIKQQIADKKTELDKLQKAYDQAAAAAGQNAEKAGQLQNQMNDNLTQQSAKNVEKENFERNLEYFDTMHPELEDTEKEAQKKELVEKINALTKEVEELKTTYRELEGQLNSIGGSDITGASQALVSAQAEISGLEASLSQAEAADTASVPSGVTGAQINNMKISENLAELAKLSTEELVAKGKEGIKAEFDGIISDVKAVEGSAAMQGGELFTLVSNKDVSVNLQVSTNDFDKLKIGNSAVVKLGDSTYKGTLTDIDKIALPNEKGNPVIGAKIHIDNPDDNIYLGVTAKVSMTIAEKKNTLYLPNEVINTGAEGDFVYVVADGKVKKQMIELGVTSAARTEVTAGIKEGEQVISDTMGSIKEGMQVTAVQEEKK